LAKELWFAHRSFAAESASESATRGRGRGQMGARRTERQRSCSNVGAFEARLTGVEFTANLSALQTIKSFEMICTHQ
jgi:hypothetical protein